MTVDSAKAKLPRAKEANRALINTDEIDEEENALFDLTAMPSWLASFLLNISLILILVLLPSITTEIRNTVSLEATEIASVAIEDISVNLEDLEVDASDVLETEMSAAPSEDFAIDSEPLTVDTDILNDAAELFAGDTTSFDGDLLSEFQQSELSSEIGGRGDSTRNQLLRKFGGNAASEAAVELALQWIADHQLPDGGWNLDHTVGPKVNNRPRTSSGPGELTEARFGATALALLPFLGSGQTHRNGKHKKVVFNGLKFLMERQVARGKGLTYWDQDGEMYSHGLVSIVFAEAYAMTNDPQLLDFVTGTIDFTIQAQDPVGGGWRYTYREAGDTSVVGWQLMALKSAKLSGIEIKNKPFKLAKKFLDRVSIDYGAYYGYLEKPSKTERGEYSRTNRARTAIGLLCRMYLGWERERTGLAKGIEWLSEIGPDVRELDNKDEVINMYYNYYATQVLKHYGGEKWRTWNASMRDFLVDSQEQNGPEKGSWHFNLAGQYQAPGGRLYTTSLACLTLEVYYRYLPLYQDKVTEVEFVTD